MTPAASGAVAYTALSLRFSCWCLILIGMTYTKRQLENRRKACRDYRERRMAEGWRFVQSFLPPNVASEVLRFKDKRVAEYRAKRLRAVISA
jgi:hypothetical protein